MSVERDYQKVHVPLSERLRLEEDWGGICFGSLKLPVVYLVDYSTDEELNERNPAMSLMSGDKESVMIWIHESVPPKLREVVLFHELIEAEPTFEHEVPPEVSHRIALWFEKTYAGKFLGEDGFRAWSEYRKKIPDHTPPLNEIISNRRRR